MQRENDLMRNQSTPHMKNKPYRVAYVEIINRCNRSCPGCPGQGSRPAGTMSVPAFKDLAKQLVPLVEKVYLHVLGEPLLHPEFSGIIDACADVGLSVGITTNGTCFSENAATVLLRPIVHQVNVSLHNLVRDDGIEDDHVDAIFQFTKRAFSERPDVYINYRFWNLENFGDDVRNNPGRNLLERISAEFDVAIPTIDPRRKKKSYRLLNRLYLNFDSRFQWPGQTTDHAPVTRGSCHGLRSQFAILVDGTVVPCCLDADGAIALGNCNNTPLEQILSSKRARAMADGFSKNVRVEPFCQTCRFADRFGS